MEFRMKVTGPAPLIQYVSHEFVINPSSPTGKSISLKFTVSPSAIVESLEMESGGMRTGSDRWGVQLVSLSTPGTALLRVPDWLYESGQTARLAVTIGGEEWLSAPFSWSQSPNWLQMAMPL